MIQKFKVIMNILIMNINILFCGGSYEILNISSDARSLSLYGSAESVDSYYLKNNPANLSIRSIGKKYTYLMFPSGINFGSYQSIINKKYYLQAVKIELLNYGEIIDSKTLINSHSFDFLIEYAYKKIIKNNFSAGAKAGFLYSSIANYNSYLCYSNYGIRSHMYNKKLGFGFSLENLGWILNSYTNYKERLPEQIRIAIHFTPQYLPILISSDFIKPKNSNLIYFNGGLEFINVKSISIRLGITSNKYNYSNNNFYSDIFYGLSTGIGFKIKKMNVDIVLTNYGSAGLVTGFSINKLKADL